MKHSRIVLLFAMIAGVLSGCQSIPANKPAVTSAPPPPISLVITVEDDDMTEEEYKARRDALIAYLIERGYITSEADLVADGASAGRLIRATLGADGGFKLSVYNLDSEPVAVADTSPVATYGVYASYSIPAYYYGDYYYYGWAPVPFYGYASWPAYYPIYPTYPVCLPPKPRAPFCAPGGSYRYRDWCPEPTPYVHCTPQPKSANRWAWQQPYPNSNPNWSLHGRYGRGNSSWDRRPAQTNPRPEFAAATASPARANAAAPNGRTSNRGNRHYNQNQNPNRRVTPAGDTVTDNATAGTTQSPTPARVRPTPNNQRTAGQPVRPFNPDRPIDGRVDRPTMPDTAGNPGNDQRPRGTYTRANAPDNRNATARPDTPDRRPMPHTARNSGNDSRQPNAYPRANTPDSRNAAARPGNAPDNRQRNYTPNPNHTPRPANVANNARPTPPQTQRHDSAPRSAPAPRAQPSGNQNRSNPPPSSSSGSRNVSSARESTSTNQEAAR